MNSVSEVVQHRRDSDDRSKPSSEKPSRPQSSSQGVYGNSLHQGERRSLPRSKSSTTSSSGVENKSKHSAHAENISEKNAYQPYIVDVPATAVTSAQVPTIEAYGTSGASIGTSVTGERRKGRFRQEVIRCPETAQGPRRQVRRRLLTPEPDILERVYIQRVAAEVVEEITEVPMTPPPIVRERTVVEPAGPPKVIRCKVRVPPRGTTAPVQGTGVQYTDQIVNAGGYNNVPLTTAPLPPPTAPLPPSNFNFSSSNFAPVGTNYQLPAPLVFSVGGDGNQSQPLPPVGCQPAFCFYI